jgi:hypothetical protein
MELEGTRGVARTRTRASEVWEVDQENCWVSQVTWHAYYVWVSETVMYLRIVWAKDRILLTMMMAGR